MPKEQYMCQLCANHGIYNQPKKGHKQKCPHRSCPCNLCALNTKRRALDQIERQLRNANQISEKPTKIVVEDPLPVSDTINTKRVSRSPSPVTAMKLAATCLPPIVKPPRTIFSANSPMPIYCVTLPATISKKALKRSVKRIEEQTKKARLLEESEAGRTRPSIFHSAEELALAWLRTQRVMENKPQQQHQKQGRLESQEWYMGMLTRYDVVMTVPEEGRRLRGARE
ncbi:hypothetical protein QR680_006986 [Steinernema hermaphroditum]|uniref:DM domain-containing protein n=1 Tax=Steinernema hermaphroditum TaxID=289476 RepID=A0AA39LXE5_9BILA|nr:hypothetical protein QR680_006986 [Steinernema hermaphroditum]